MEDGDDAFGGDEDSRASDARFDAFLGQELQLAQQTGHQENVGFLDTLRNAKQNDPAGFYILLSAFASGDPDKVAQVAMQLRSERMGTQAARRQELMEVAGKRIEQRLRKEEADEARTFRASQNAIQKLRDTGLLDAYMRETGGKTPETIEEIRNMEQWASGRLAERTEEKEMERFIEKVASAKRFIPLQGKYAEYARKHPDFADSYNSLKGAFEDAKARTDEMRNLRKERLQQVMEMAKKVDPDRRENFILTMYDLREADADLDNWEGDLHRLEAITASMEEVPDMIQAQLDDARIKVAQAQQARQRANERLDVIRAGGKQPAMQPLPSPRSTAPTAPRESLDDYLDTLQKPAR